MVEVQQRVLAALPVLLLAAAVPPAGADKFYADDPLWKMPPPRRVEKAKRRKLNDYYDFFQNTLFRPGERHPPGKPVRAGAVNTLGEVPDSEWFVNRHGLRRMSLSELARGPGNAEPPAQDGPWTIIRAKTEGVTPGFTIQDARGRRYMLKFDPLTNPEMATAADAIGARFFHALGYNVPENYVVTFERARLETKGDVKFLDARGKERILVDVDVDEILLRVPRTRDGRIRGVASRYLPGQLLGEFRYHGTRSDDPNDVVPHERRRDLRGLYVFCAWLGHDDSRAINTLDSLVEEGKLRYIRHYLVDFGSILGSASTKPNSARSGNEHLFSFKPAAAELLTLGLYVPRWARARFPDLPSVGRFESTVFDPERYRVEYPNPAFSNCLPDDAFWAARRVMAFTDEEIRAVVKAGEYSDPRAERWVAECLMARRDKIGKAYYRKVLALDRFEVRAGRLAFDNLQGDEVSIRWFVFDNQTGTKTPIAGAEGFDLPQAGSPFLAAELAGPDPKKTVTVYLRRGEVVGVERFW